MEVIDLSIKEFPLWGIIGILALILISPFTFFFAQRKTHNASLQKRRKLLLIALGAVIVLYLIVAVICHIRGMSFGQVLLSNTPMIVGLIAIFLYAFFRKDKEQKQVDEIELQE